MRTATAIPAVMLIIMILVAGCGTAPDESYRGRPAEPTTRGSGTATPTVDCEYVKTTEAARPVDEPVSSGVIAAGVVKFIVTTNEGDVVITTNRAATPCTVNAFQSLVQQGFYDNTRCHRLVDGAKKLLECGDPTGTGTGGPGYTIPDELTGSETYYAGVVAMANQGRPHSAGSQFFITYADVDLPPNNTILGTTDAAGLAVIKRIAAAGQDDSNPVGGGKPRNPARIIKIVMM